MVVVSPSTALGASSSVTVAVGAERDGLAEGHQHSAPEGLAGLEGQADRHQRQRRPALAFHALAPPRLVLEGDAGRAGLDPLHARLGMGGALRVDADEAARGQGPEAGGEGVHVPLCSHHAHASRARGSSCFR